MKENKEVKKLEKEEKKKLKKQNKKKIDKMRLATQIIAGMMAFLMVLGIAGSFLYYFIRMV